MGSVVDRWRLVSQIAILLAFLVASGTHLAGSWRFPQYQFFPILVVIAAYLSAQRGLRVNHMQHFAKSLPSPFSKVSVVAIVLLVFAVAMGSSRLSFISLLLYGGGFVWWMKSKGINLVGPWMLLWFLVRPPGFVERTFSQSLQAFSSEVSSKLLDVMQINHVMLGNVLRFPGRELFVDEACSGVVSLFSVLGFGAGYIVWSRYSWIRGLFLLLASLLWATILNVGRIVVIAAADRWYSVDLAEGPPHTILGLVLFCATIAGFYCTDQFLHWLIRPIPENPTVRPNPLETFWNAFADQDSDMAINDVNISAADNTVAEPSGLLMPISYLVAGLFLTHWLVVGRQDYSNADSVLLASEVTSASIIASSDVGSVPIRTKVIKRDPHSPLGAFSKVFRIGEAGKVFSLDYPFFGYWHELSGCYTAQGWKIDKRTVVQHSEDLSNLNWDVVRLDITHSTSKQKAVVYFSLCDIAGEPVAAPSTQTIWENVRLEFQMRFFKSLAGEVIQFQLFVPGEADPIQASDYLKQFCEDRDRCFMSMFKKPAE